MPEGAARIRASAPPRGPLPTSVHRPVAALLLPVLVVAAVACSSPNRGRWRGTFAGGVSGEMEFTVNARGTRADGRITGTTSRGEPFEAEFEGSLNQDFLNARLEGASQTGVGLPARFEGELQGTLEGGVGEGYWSVDLVQVRGHYEGSWSAAQIAE